MLQYETYKQYSDRTGLSLSSVYRAARKGKLKTTDIKGVSHVIVEEGQEEGLYDVASDFVSGKGDKEDNDKYDKIDKGYKDVEVLERNTDKRYEIEVFKSSIATIEEMANRIEAAKDEMISSLKETIDNQNKNLDNLNSVILTISSDNQELRTQLGIREAELKMWENKIFETDNLLGDKDKEINNKNQEILRLNEKIDKLNDKINDLEKKELLNSDHNEPIKKDTIWDKAKKL